MKTATICDITLSNLHQRTVAVEMSVAGRQRTVVGQGAYERDPDLGQVLRIELTSTADGELILSDDAFSGDILPGEEMGCDYLIRLA